jgi:integrase
MKKAYRMIQRKDRSGMFYILNKQTNERRSLETTDRAEAQRLLDVENQARETSSLNMQLGVVYLRNSDPEMAKRTWQFAMNELSSHGKETSQKRCQREMDSKAFDLIRDKAIIETTSEDLKAVLKRGGSATNNYLRRLHNLVVGNGWTPYAIIPPKQWDKPVKREKRGITSEEHNKIIAAEQNEERRLYYELLWLIGSAQTDASLLSDQNINWKERVLSYQRMKTKEWCFLSIGDALEKLLMRLSQKGFLFPKIATLSDKDRAAEFSRRCRLLKIKGISLHSYRYAWAERAYAAGYEERFAQAALGHASKAVHHAYARKAKVVCPPLESLENKVVPFTQATETEDLQRKSA